MRFLRKHGGWMTLLAAVLALAIMGGVLLSMAARPSLSLMAVREDQEALESVVITGQVGDYSFRTDFTLQGGQLTQEFHPQGLRHDLSSKNGYSMAVTQPTVENAWLNPEILLVPEGTREVSYQEEIEEGTDGHMWYSVRRITRCEKVRVWAGISRIRRLTGSKVPDDYRSEVLVPTDIVLDMADLSARYGRELALAQFNGHYGVVMKDDGSYEKPSYQSMEIAYQDYQLWDLENEAETSLEETAGGMNLAVLKGETYFVPDVAGPGGETALYRVTSYQSWFETAFSESIGSGSAEKLCVLQPAPGCIIRGLYPLENHGLLLVQTGPETLCLQLLSGETGEELDRWEFASPEKNFSNSPMESYQWENGAVLTFWDDSGKLWIRGFTVEEGKLLATQELTVREPPGAYYLEAASVVEGKLVLLFTQDYTALPAGEELPQEQRFCYELRIWGEGTDALYRITTPIAQDYYSLEWENGETVRYLHGVKIEGREQP